MRDILDAYNDDEVRRITMMFSSQMSKTEALLNMACFAMDKRPGPMMIMQPTTDMAKAFVKDRLDPTIRDTERIRDKIRTAKDTGNDGTLLRKVFPGGQLTMIGGNSPAQLASRPIRDLFVDEIDRMALSVGKMGQAEGDPFSLAEKRQTTFWNSKTVVCSTPGVKGISRIEDLYNESTMERYWVPCPHCGSVQVLVFANVHWPEGRPELAWYECAHCSERILDRHKSVMLACGTWIAEHPERTKYRGFHINELYSPWRGFGDIATAFIAAKHSGRETLRVFFNTVLGESWDNMGGEQLDATGIRAREESYDAEVPMDAIILTAAVDVQADRLELLFMGHGLENEKWIIPTENAEGKMISPAVIWGPPNRESTWRMLDAHLFRQFKHESGRKLRVSLVLVDASDGNVSDFVYRYTKARAINRVFACSGSSNPSAPLSAKPTDGNQYRAKLFKLGVNNAKDMIADSLREITGPGPGYFHFPEGLDEEFYRQLTGEKAIIKYKMGLKYRIWTKTRERNEVLDLTVYNFCAFTILDVKDLRQMLAAMKLGHSKTEKPKARKRSEVK
jgi:phage terminase large subunit GpA-like protein